jgi:cysteine synthase A
LIDQISISARISSFVWTKLYRSLAIKWEGFNFGWSIKLRTALFMVKAAECNGDIGPGATMAESSSGNLGVALSVIAASRSMNFICVADPNCKPQAVALMRVAGAVVDIVQLKDENGDAWCAARFPGLLAVLDGLREGRGVAWSV